MRKILVTGGTGYIGSHTVVELIESGFDPIIVDNLSNSKESILDQILKITGVRPAFERLDLCDGAEVCAFAKKHHDIQGIIHFAALKAVGESVQQPLRYYKNNLCSVINLLEAFGDREINIVFSSSCTVYGQPDNLPVREEAPVKKAESPYGNTKQVAEEILQETARTNSQYKVIALRYFNPVGAHDSGLIGELPIGVPQNLVPFITQSAIGKRGPIQVFGNDYPTTDGSAIRDYIHVVDLAKAHVRALKLLEKGNPNGPYDVFNIGTGHGSSVLEVIAAFQRSTGINLNYDIAPRRAGDIVQVWGNVEKSENELGWKAELSLDEMLRSAWKWECYLNENPLS